MKSDGTTISRDLLRSDRPRPDAKEEAERWDETDLRHRIMIGQWKADATKMCESFWDPEVAANMKSDTPDIGINPAKHISQEISVVYHRPPTVAADSDEDELALLNPPGTWAQLAELNRLTTILQECFVRLDFSAEGKKLTYRVVTPSFIEAWAYDWDPSIPCKIRETRWRDGVVLDGEWTRETWDVTEPDDPRFTVERWVDDGGKAAAWQETDDYQPENVPEGGYPYVDKAGKGILPYPIYHKRVKQQLWNWQADPEIIDGTLRVAAYATMWGHGYRNANYRNVHAVDMEPMSMKLDRRSGSGEQVGRIVSDPTSITRWTRKNPAGGFFEMQATVDPLQALQALQMKISSLAIYMGLSSTDIEVSGSPESGVALSIRKEGKQEQQQQQIEPYRMADQRRLATAARMLNSYMGTNLPENPEDYSVVYVPIAKSPAQIEAELKRVDAMTERGLADEIDQLRVFHPEMTEEQAEERLVQVAERKARLAAKRAMIEAEMPTKPPPPPRPPKPEIATQPVPGVEVDVEAGTGETSL